MLNADWKRLGKMNQSLFRLTISMVQIPITALRIYDIYVQTAIAKHPPLQGGDIKSLNYAKNVVKHADDEPSVALNVTEKTHPDGTVKLVK